MTDLLVRRLSAIRAAKGKPHYDWMHPSWRDLIIDHLAGNPKSRFDFLQSCGPNGIQLALSWGGGIQGERRRPLLDSAEDWYRLHSTIKLRLATELESAVYAILSSILDATIQVSRSEEETQRAILIFLNAIAKDAVLILRERWDKANTVIPVETLQIYTQLSEMLDPLPPMPQLIPTWNVYRAAATAELTFDPYETELQTYGIGKWIDLIECISGSEPRMLTQVKFPSSSLDDVQQFLEAVVIYIESDTSLDTREDYETVIETLSEVKIINRICEVVPSTKEEISILSTRVDSKRSQLEDDLTVKFPEPDYDGGDLKPSGGITIDEILSDL